jgi:hypothetical protein
LSEAEGSGRSDEILDVQVGTAIVVGGIIALDELQATDDADADGSRVT